MSTRFFSTGVALAAAALVVAAFRPASSPETTVTLRVSSAIPGTSVAFKGAYVFEGQTLQIVERATPFEVSGTGPLALGIFERQGSGPDLQVEVLREGEPVPRAQGTSARAIVGNNLAGTEVFFRGY